MIKLHFLAALILAFATPVLAADVTTATNVLQTLRPAHPRLLVLNDQLPIIREIIKSNPQAMALDEQLQAEGERLLMKPPLQYVIGGPEHTLLDVSRNVEGRVWLLAGLYRLHGDRRFAVRAREEMLAAAQFPDWYPKHFLDTAEMTAALGVGYDWLFDFLSPADRAAIREAIVTKGLDPGIAAFSPGGKGLGWHNNWVQVCAGGLTLGALAIADEEPAKAATMVELARPPMEKIMRLFAPDGGFEEGPGYWNYATAYNAWYLAGVESALGTDFGLAQAPGFADTGNYWRQVIGPIGKAANFGDAGEEMDSAPQMFWLARKFNRPEYAQHERGYLALTSPGSKRRNNFRFSIFDLLWYQPAAGSGEPTPLSGAKFDRIAAAFFRSDWDSSNAMYIAFKGGNNHASHGHLDLGTFILDAFGERWAVDLGADSYGLPGYFGSKRWSYYRLRTEGHNTLTIGNQNEDLKAEAPLVAFSAQPDRSFAIADLKSAYPQTLSNWQRGVRLLNHRQMLVQDEVHPLTAVDITWNFHTRAAIAISPSGNEATLSQGSVRLLARILSPANARFAELEVNPPAPQKPAPDIHNLIIRLPPTEEFTTITVLLGLPDDAAPTPRMVPLKQW